MHDHETGEMQEWRNFIKDGTTTFDNIWTTHQ